MIEFFDDLYEALGNTSVWMRASDRNWSVALGYSQLTKIFRFATDTSNTRGRLMFIGNGGSAAIASHMAADYQKNGSYRTLTFNDAAALTCLANDLGYEEVFAHPILKHALPSDVLIAISSSGRSANILAAVEAARINCANVVTLSGFDNDNPLRRAGHVNFYVRSHDYGVVECAHLALLHGFLNMEIGNRELAPEPRPAA